MTPVISINAGIHAAKSCLMIYLTVGKIPAHRKLRRAGKTRTDQQEEKMYWKKFLPLAILVVMMAGSIVGCSSTAETSVVTPTTSAEPTTPANPGAPPGFSGSDNMTPPQGGAPGDRQAMPSIDYAAAAQKLGVTEQQLKDALGETTQGLPDFAVAAQTLGVSEETLREALGFTAMQQPPDRTSLPDGSQPQPPDVTSNP
jgi:hypothetical protein